MCFCFVEIMLGNAELKAVMNVKLTPLLIFVCWPDCKPEGPLFSAAESVCLSVCVSLTGTSTLQHWPILTKLGHKDHTLI